MVRMSVGSNPDVEAEVDVQAIVEFRLDRELPTPMEILVHDKVRLRKRCDSPRFEGMSPVSVYRIHGWKRSIDELGEVLAEFSGSKDAEKWRVRRAVLNPIGSQHGTTSIELDDHAEQWKQWYLQKAGVLEYRRSRLSRDGQSFPVVGIVDSGIEAVETKIEDPVSGDVAKVPMVVHPNLVNRDAELKLCSVGLGGAVAAAKVGEVVDLNGHGTHVAGIIGASPANCGGMVGICPESELQIFKCTEGATEYCYLSNLLDSIFAFALGLGGGRNGVLCVSVGFDIQRNSADNRGREAPRWIDQLVDFLEDQFAVLERRDNLLIVAAAGNEFGDRISFPANQSSNNPSSERQSKKGNNILAVGSMDAEDNVSPFSNSGPSLSMLAPGKGIFSTYPSRYSVKMGYPVGHSTGYAYLEGTSMSAAIVAGIAALKWAEQPEASGSQIAKTICESCVGQVAGLERVVGYGLVQAARKEPVEAVRLRTSRAELLKFPVDESSRKVLRSLLAELFDDSNSLRMELKGLFDNFRSFDERLACETWGLLSRKGHRIESDSERNAIAWSLWTLFNVKYQPIWGMRKILGRMIADIPSGGREANAKLSLFQQFLHQCWSTDPALLKQFLGIQYPDEVSVYEMEFNQEAIAAFIRLSSDENLVPLTPYEPDLSDKNLKCW